ncbi:MAG: hypothetical protein ACK55Z_15870, partial [bacterium]
PWSDRQWRSRRDRRSVLRRGPSGRHEPCHRHIFGQRRAGLRHGPAHRATLPRYDRRRYRQ